MNTEFRMEVLAVVGVTIGALKAGGYIPDRITYLDLYGRAEEIAEQYFVAYPMVTEFSEDHFNVGSLEHVEEFATRRLLSPALNFVEAKLRARRIEEES